MNCFIVESYRNHRDTTYVWMARDGPEAGRDKLARVFALLPEQRLLHVGNDLEDDAEDVEGPADVVL